MNIAACVILYHPEKISAKKISSYAKYVNRIYILDNTENNTYSFKIVQESPEFNKIIYFHDGENKGISVRLNQAATLAVNEGFEWLLTMDQDSHFEDETVPIYLNCLMNYPNHARTAMFGVQFLDKLLENKSCLAEEVRHLITSGSVVNLSLFKEIGNFDEALFIDKVDHEYCLRAGLFNYKIIRFNNIYMNHNLGSIIFGRSLKSFKTTPRVIHSPIRMYYILRNYLYLHTKYKGQFQDSFNEMRHEILNRIKNNLLYGKKRRLLLKYLIKGYLDYKKNNMGKVS